MDKVYRWTFSGTTGTGGTWTTAGVTRGGPRDIVSAFMDAGQQSFEQLTQGKAIFGQPGVGCEGPYNITRAELTAKED